MPVPDTASGTPLSRSLLRDEAEAVIRDAILCGQLKPGEQLNDRELQAWLGVSRTPVREALHGLQVQGLIETSAQSYTRVAAPNPEKIGDLLQTIGIILAGAVRFTTPELDDETVAALQGVTANAREAVARCDALAHLDAAEHFYDLLLTHCTNRSLAKYIESSLIAPSFQYRANIGTWQTDWTTLAATWGRLSTALDARDADGAARAIEAMHRLWRSPDDSSPV